MKRLSSLMFVGLGVGLAVPAAASYELLLVLDGSTKSVHRFDPQSGAYFGSFGGGWLNNPQSMVMDQSSNTCYIRDTQAGAGIGDIIAFNYNTGERVTGGGGGMAFQGSPVQMARRAVNGDFYTSGTSDVYQYNSSGTFISSRLGLNDLGGLCIGPDGNLYITNTVSNIVFKYSTSVPIGSASILSSSAATTDFGDGQLTFGGSSVRGYFATAFPRVMSFDPNTYAFTQINMTNFSATKGVAFGHDDVLYTVGVDSAGTAGIVQRFDTRLGVLGGTFGSGVLVNPLSAACVVAPEPITMIGFGLGISLLVIRRRKKS